MGKKHTQEYVDKFIEIEGWINKSIYIDSHTKLNLICPNGHKQYKKFNDFQQGYRCQICAGNNKHTQEFVDNYIKSKGWINISKYINSHEKLELICPNNHITFNTFKDFYSGKMGCLKCSGLEKYTQEYIDNYIVNERWINNSIYINTHTKLELICPNGHKQLKTFDSFKSGKRCQKCYFKYNRGENHSSFNKDRTRKNRIDYLGFEHNKLNTLKDEPLYNLYIKSQSEAKLDDNIWSRTEYSVDHIYPRKAFIDNNLDNIYGKTLIKEICNLRENIRIIHRKENGTKGSKYNQKNFITWFNIKIMKENNFVFL